MIVPSKTARASFSFPGPCHQRRLFQIPTMTTGFSHPTLSLYVTRLLVRALLNEAVLAERMKEYSTEIVRSPVFGFT